MTICPSLRSATPGAHWATVSASRLNRTCHRPSGTSIRNRPPCSQVALTMPAPSVRHALTQTSSAGVPSDSSSTPEIVPVGSRVSSTVSVPPSSRVNTSAASNVADRCAHCCMPVSENSTLTSPGATRATE